MDITFYKYQGTGNDFVMIDNRTDFFPKNDTKLIANLCDRRFGIGADGLILLCSSDAYDFRMVYFNADGRESSMCGNGGRCIVAFARSLKLIERETNFIAADGPHFATIYEDGSVSLQMKDVINIRVTPEYAFLDTGSPHHIEMCTSVTDVDVRSRGSEIRYSETYSPGGTNVNFVEQQGDSLFVLRTYERGVEDETLSCGTGATAAAIAMYALGKTNSESIRLKVMGGELEVNFSEQDGVFSNVFLKGPAVMVFRGGLTFEVGST
jgi:diaminopimelate epimerase